MAEKLNVSRATLINYEKGHTAINIDVLDRIKNHYPDFETGSHKPEKPKIVVDNSIDFKVLFNILNDSKKNILFITIFFAILGTSSSFIFKKYYEAQITLYPAKKELTQGIGQLRSLAMNLGINNPNNEQSFNIPDVVKSRLIASKVINQKWQSNDGAMKSLIELWKMDQLSKTIISFNSISDSSTIIEKAINKFRDHIQVSEDRITGLITISTTFQDPLISADIANFIGKQVELYIQKENSAQSKKEKLFIFERLSIVKKELEGAELSLKKFKERNRGYEDSPELFMLYSQLNREVEAKKEVYLTLQQQLELARIEEVKRSPVLHILDYAIPPNNKSSPNRLMFFLIATILGFALSSIRIVFRY